jgi:trans-aconitate 2-methyltransferase
VVYSNAALHWLVNHDKVFPDMIQRLVKPNGGVLAVQMPDTRQQASHLLMGTAAVRSSVMDEIIGVRIPRVEQNADWYYSILSPITRDIDMWSTDYVQQLESTYEEDMTAKYHPVLEYTKGTGLLPIMEALGGEQSEKCQRYLREYNRLLSEQYPTVMVKNYFNTQGKMVTLMPFKRFFITCRT